MTMKTTHDEMSVAPKLITVNVSQVLPAFALVAGMAAVYAFRLDQYVSFEQLRSHRGELTAYVTAMPVTATLAFIAAYAVATALSFPGAIVLTLAGGFLFGIWAGTVAVVAGATIGATLLFIAARSALGDLLRAKAGPWLARMEEGFKDNALSYLLVLRLVPAFPFFIVNLVPAFLGVPLRTFVIATGLGIVPGTFVFASIGAGLGSIFDNMEEFTLKGALTPQIITALVGLSLLSLLPIVLKKIKARHTARVD